MSALSLLYSLGFRRYKAVSFDIFDTLLERDVARPVDVFLRVGDIVLGAGKGEAFQKDRIAAESAARSKALNGEVTLAGIYEELIAEGYDRETAEELQAQEVSSELTGCFVKESMKPVFDAALQQGKTVFLVSDMYLPKEVIAGMVSRCGYEGYEKLFVSNEYGVSKRSGKLFEEVCREYGLEKQDLLHLGDSIGADLLGARKAGVAALPVRRKNRLGRLLKR
ncbi:MAG: HAD-IA family hydrolase [Clostridia bacterium]|nr:HAD-IA family hydrolase [Clostridia bacterium]